VAFSPDSRRCLSGDKEGTVRLWDVETGEELRSFALGSNPVTTICFSGDGSGLCAAGPTTDSAEKPKSFRQAAWDADTGRVRHNMQSVRSAELAMPTLLALSPGGKRFVIVESISAPGGLQLCKVESLDFGNVMARVRPAVEPKAGATCVAVSPDGAKALTGGGPRDAALRLWDLERGSVKAFGGLTSGVHCVALSPDMRYALSDAGGKSIQVWDLTKTRALRALAGHTKAVTCLALSPDGRHALSASQDKTVRLWDVQTGRELYRLKGHTDVVHGVAFSPDGRLALTGGADKTVRLWQLPIGKTVATGPKVRYLSDMEETEVEVSEGRFGKKGRLGFSAAGSDRIRVNGKEQPHGLSMHALSNASATAKYDLGKTAQTFLASVALNDSAGAPNRPPGRGRVPSPLRFLVLGDGKVLWRSKPVDVARNVQECKVDVKGVEVLELRVDCPGLAVNAHAVWLEPRILLK
jgi:WD40 repeat protein